MNYDLIKSTLSNGFSVLITDCPNKDINRVYGAVQYEDKWVLPAEFPFLNKVYEDLKLLRSWRDGVITISPSLKTELEDSIAKYQTEEIHVPKLGNTELMPHQIKACQKTFINPRYGLYMDCRTGKTLVILYTIVHLRLKALVVGPRIACNNWLLEIEKHMPQLKAISIYGKNKKDRDLLLDKASKEDYDVVITSFENLRIIKDELKEKLHYDCVVVDESHRIKSYSASRTKAILSISEKAKHRYLLSGTPTMGKPTDIYAQMIMLSPSILSKWGYWRFTQNFLVYNKPKVIRDRFGNKDIEKRRYPVGAKNLEVLNTMIAPYHIRVRRGECEGLPDREDIYIAYELSPAQKKMYRQIVEDDEYDVNGDTFVIENGAVKFMKLSMICSGFIYYYPLNTPRDENDRPLAQYRKTYNFPKNPKLDALEEHLEDYLANPENKVVIWSNYDAEQDYISDKFSKHGVRELRGSMDGDPFDTVQEFCSSDSIHMLSAKQSMGISIDLSAASYAFNFSRSANFDFDRQSRDRIDGYRQKAKTINNFYFTCPNTTDEHIHELIKNKENLDKTLTDINKKCIGCKHIVKCINQSISYKAPKCKYEKVKI